MLEVQAAIGYGIERKQIYCRVTLIYLMRCQHLKQFVCLSMHAPSIILCIPQQCMCMSKVCHYQMRLLDEDCVVMALGSKGGRKEGSITSVPAA